MTCGGLRAAIAAEASGFSLIITKAIGTEHRVRLGVTVDGHDLAIESQFVRSVARSVVESLAPASGKATTPSVRSHEEMTATFADADGREWAVVVRLADDGVALRYEIPNLQGLSTLSGEATTLHLSGFDRAWMSAYQTWYETPRFGQDLTDLETGEYSFPALLRHRGGGYVFVTESGIDGRFCGSHAGVDAEKGALTFRHADETTEIARGVITPWRVFIIGSLSDIVESQFVDELAPVRHHTIARTDWVRPGRAAWSWWSDFYSGAQLDQQKHFVDVAAQLGWEHLLIDCGWEETWVPEIVSYASRFGIQVHLWTVWHDLDGAQKLERLSLWRSWGVAGIKVDFMESESKDRYRWYDVVLQETARLGLMVNFHGSVIPRGWARTWPHVLGYEAIRGSEYYVFYNDTPLTAGHNVIQPFTRNVVGAMDYTPVAFTAPGRTTSDGHELGLSVAFECGITHFADSVDAYLDRPLAAKFLAELAPSWDETRMLSGTPDTKAVLARRSGDRWFVGGIATGPSRTLNVALDRLGHDTFDAWIVTDEPNGNGRGLRAQQTDVTGEMNVRIARDGGFAAILAPAGTSVFRAAPIEAEQEPTIARPLVELDEQGRGQIEASGADRIRVAPGWQVASHGQGRWTIQAPGDLGPGRLGVVTVETDGPRGVPLVAHARLVRPLAGVVALSELPMLSFRNESGPVERNMSNGGGNPRDGRRITIAGDEHDSGLGMSSPAEARFHLGGHGTRLTGVVGIDDETQAATATAIVEADGEELLRCELVSGNPAIPFDLDLRERTTLTLRTEPRSRDAAHIDWASAQITSSTPAQS